MSNFGFLSGKDDSAVENLLSQAKDLYVLEQVSAINCAGFTDSALPPNVEARFRRLKSLPVSRTDPVSSSTKPLSHSRSMASHRNAFSASASGFSGDGKSNFSGIKRNLTVKSRPSVDETRIFSGIKRDPSVNSRAGDFLDSGKFGSVSLRFSQACKNFSNSGKIGSISSRFSGDGKVFSPPTQKPRTSSGASSSGLDREELSNRKSKSKLSWFEKLSPSRALGCLCLSPSITLPNSKKTMKSNNNMPAEEQLKKMILQ